MLRRVDRGTHISLVPMPLVEAASLTPRPASRLFALRGFFGEAEIPRLVGDAFLLALVMLALFLVIPFK